MAQNKDWDWFWGF